MLGSAEDAGRTTFPKETKLESRIGGDNRQWINRRIVVAVTRSGLQLRQRTSPRAPAVLLPDVQVWRFGCEASRCVSRSTAARAR